MRRNRGFAFVIKEMEICCQENPTCEFSEECKALYDIHCDHWAVIKAGATAGDLDKSLKDLIERVNKRKSR